MQHIFVLNPAAGQTDTTATLAQKIQATLGRSAVIYYTKGIGDATAFVRKYAQTHTEDSLRFYACGGDGTFSEVVGGAVGFSHVAVGLIPVGTGNDFVRNFKSSESFLSIDCQRDGKEIPIDLLRCNDRYCVNMLNTGFDCEVVAKMQEIKRRVPAGMAYALGVVIELIKKPCATMTVYADGELVDSGKRLLCAVGNGSFYGGGYHPLPDASLSDGYMDICLVKNVSRPRFVTLIGKYKKGTHIVPKTKKIIRVLRCRKLLLEFPEARRVSIDGELIMLDRCEVEVLPAALRLVLPVGCAMLHDEGL
ncbi:MAG: diacylglycerol kinase family lipid kinase [Clostridia bacterium]|nr:diacylglycerol kinase family lipid kinase [Clostridia bacterium]